MNDRPTYPELLKLFYKHSFPDKLGDSCSSMAQAIIYKSNDLWFPASFDMSNKELSHLSGVKLTNLQRTRQKLLEGCKIDRIPLFTYVSGGTQKAGTYKINFTLGATLTSLYVQKQPDSAHDPNTTLPNETKQDPPTPQNDITTGNEEVELTEVDGLVKLLLEKFKREPWRQTMPPPVSLVSGLHHRYGLSPVVDAIETAEPNSKSWSGILGYIDPIAKRLSAQSRGVSGEKLDQMEKDYQEMIQDLDDARKELDAGKPVDPAYIEQQTTRAGILHDAIMANGGSVKHWV